MTRLSKADILGRARPTREVEVPEWGGAVTIAALSAGDLEEWHNAHAAPGAEAGLGVAMLIMLSVRDGDGPMFGPNDMGFLKAQAAVVLKPLVDAIFNLNGLDGAAREATAGN